MDANAVITQLAQWGNPARRKHARKRGAGENQYGVMMGTLRDFAIRLGRDNALAFSIWATGNEDARMLASMIIDPARLTMEQAERMLAGLTYMDLVDKLIWNAVSETPFAAEARAKWIDAADLAVSRAGWNLVILEVLEQNPSAAQLEDYVTRVERGLVDAPTMKQEAMNRALCEIGIRYPEWTDRCVAIGEALGVYKDLKVSKGCTSSYAPAWIAAGIKKRRPKE